MLLQALCIISYPLVNSNLSYRPETLNSGQKQRLFEPCDLEILRMILNKANLGDLIAATGLVILLKLDSIVDFSARVTLKFDGWPQNTIGHLFYATLSFLHNFVAIGELKLELQSGNA